MIQPPSNLPAVPALQSSPALRGERLSFTGTLASMTHRQAMELAEEQGGSAAMHVSKQMTMLVVGEEGWPLESDGRPSLKLQQVTEWRHQGLDIKLLHESEWLRLLGLEERRRDVHRLLTPAMLSQSLNVSVGLIRHWERIGLIKPAKKVFRLPYFDFREVACVRRLSELLKAGVPRARLESSLGKLQAMLPGAEQSLAQLTLLVHDHEVVIRDAAGVFEPATRQRLLDFLEENAAATEENVSATEKVTGSISLAGSEKLLPTSLQNRTAQDWFDQGCRWLEDNRPPDAVEAFRLSLVQRPFDPEVHFHLAEALYRSGNLAGAFERFHVAVELDQNYLEAWTQLGCVASEMGQTDSALDAFNIALQSHADYPDAHFHKAELLHRLDREHEARPHWQAYLAQDQRGPWADVARQRLDANPESQLTKSERMSKPE